MIKYSIIILTYNSEKYIRQCLDSIKNLNYNKSNYEVIVADNGSKDKTLDILKEYKAKILHNPNNISLSRNIAAKKAKGKFLVFIDSDCIVPKDLLKNASKLDCDCFGSFYIPAKKATWVAKCWLYIEQKKQNKVDWLPGGNIIIKKQLFNEIKGFNINLKTAEDFDLCYRVRKKGYEIYNDPNLACIHLGQTNTLIKFFKKEMWRGNSLIKSIKEHGILKEELLSTLITFYHFMAIILFIISFFLIKIYPEFLVISLSLLILPSILLGLRKAFFVNLKYAFEFMFLIFTYQMARAISIIAYNQFRDLF
jgi:glycosyltransferase involved in cell wall biosynthesis